MSGVVIVSIIILRRFLNEKKKVRWMEEFLNGQGIAEISFVRCYQWWMDGWVLISIVLGYPSSGSSFSLNSTRQSEIAQAFFSLRIPSFLSRQTDGHTPILEEKVNYFQLPCAKVKNKVTPYYYFLLSQEWWLFWKTSRLIKQWPHKNSR